MVRALEKNRQSGSDMPSAIDNGLTSSRPAWVEAIVRDALRPVEERLDDLNGPLQNIERRLRRQRAALRKAKANRDATRDAEASAQPQFIPVLAPELIQSQSAIEQVVERQSSQLDQVTQSVGRVISKLTDVDRQLGTTQADSRELSNQFQQSNQQIATLQREMTALFNGLQSQLSRPSSVEPSHQSNLWQASVEAQLAELQASLLALDDIKSTLQVAVEQNRALKGDLEVQQQKLGKLVTDATQKAICDALAQANQDSVMLGQIVGDKVCDALREQLGTRFTKEIAQQLSDSLNSDFAIPLSSQLSNQLSDQLSTQITNQVAASLASLLPQITPASPASVDSTEITAHLKSAMAEMLSPLSDTLQTSVQQSVQQALDQSLPQSVQASVMQSVQQSLQQTLTPFLQSAAEAQARAYTASISPPAGSQAVAHSVANDAIDVAPPAHHQALPAYTEEAAPVYDSQAYTGPVDSSQGFDSQPYMPPGQDSAPYQQPEPNAAYDSQAYQSHVQDSQAYNSQAYDSQAYDSQAYGAPASDSPGYDSQPYRSPSSDSQPSDSQPYESQAYDSQAYNAAGVESESYPTPTDSQAYQAQPGYDSQPVSDSQSLPQSQPVAEHHAKELPSWWSDDAVAADRAADVHPISADNDANYSDEQQLPPASHSAFSAENLELSRGDNEDLASQYLNEVDNRALPNVYPEHAGADSPATYTEDEYDSVPYSELVNRKPSYSHEDATDPNDAHAELPSDYAPYGQRQPELVPAGADDEYASDPHQEFMSDHYADIAQPEHITQSVPAADNPTVPASAAQGGEETDESVEDYMRRLLARMRGVSESEVTLPGVEAGKPASAVVPKDPSVAKPTPEPAPATENEQLSEAWTEPFDPDKYVPRGTAPEKNRDLNALRELANTSARSAIQVSARRRQGSAILIKLAIATVGLIAGVALVSINGARINVAFIATIASFLVALIWGYDAVTSIRPLLQAGRKPSQQNREADKPAQVNEPAK